MRRAHACRSSSPAVRRATSAYLPGDSERLAYWLGGTRDEKPNEYRDASPANFITADDPPMFFFHGEHDVLVPIDSPTEMVKLLKGAGVTAEMYVVKDAGHIQALFDRGALEHGAGVCG